MPISKKSFRTPAKKTIRDKVYDGNEWGIALNGEVAGRLSGTYFDQCQFIGSRYAAFLKGQEDIQFNECLFDNRDTADEGQQEEACIRIENCSRILFNNCDILNGAPKHAFRVHRFARDIALQNSRIISDGNGFMFGTYRGQSGEPSDVQDLEIFDVSTVVKATGADVDEFNVGVGGLKNFRIRNLRMQVTDPKWRPPVSNPAMGWVFEKFERV